MPRKKKTHGPFDPDTILMMEGMLQELRDLEPRLRPLQMTFSFLGYRLDRAPATIKKWRVQAKQSARRNDNAAMFVDLYDRIADMLGEVVSETPLKIAKDPANKQAMAAVKWVLPRMNPAVYGEEADTLQARDESIADVPQEVFDELTDEELEQLEGLQQQIEAAQTACEQLLLRVKKRVLDLTIAESGPLH